MTRLLLALALLLAVGCTPTPTVSVTRTPTTYPTRQPTATELPTYTVYPTAIPSMTPIPTATPPATWTPGAARWVPIAHGDVQGYEAFLEIRIPIPIEIVQGVGVVEIMFSMENRWDQPRVVQWDVYDPDTGAFYAHVWELEPHEGYSAIRVWGSCNWDGVTWQWLGHMTGDPDISQPHSGTLFLDVWIHHT